jgi:UDP-N-acetylmuramate--alanine ligase
MIQKDQVIPFIKTHDVDVLIVLGAGDLDNQVPEITRVLKEKYSL